MEFVTDRKLFVKISSDIAEMQIEKSWGISLVYADQPISNYSGLSPPGTSGIIPWILVFSSDEYYQKLERIQRPSVIEWSYLMGRADSPKFVQLNMINSDFWWEHQYLQYSPDLYENY